VASAGEFRLGRRPYKGIQPAAPDLVSGDVQLVFNAFGPLNAFVHSGEIRLLGVTSASRLAQYPDVPTLAESGLPGFDASGWYMLFALRPIAQTLDEAAQFLAKWGRAVRASGATAD
jgi:tripartite-type tricarboxylate transporter receptor subunit TctC